MYPAYVAGFPLSRLLRSFYKWRLPFLPVIDGHDEKGKLIGFLSREKLNRELTDLERFHRTYDAIPESVLARTRPPEDILLLISRSRNVPVLSLNGEQAGLWDGPTFLKNAASFQERVPEAPAPPAAKTVREVDGETWMTRLMLAALPWPLYACDLSGLTLFFNAAFETKILPLEKLKNSMRLAEAFLKETVREMIAISMTEAGPGGPVMAVVPPLGTLRVVNLEEEGRIRGYLVVFHDWKEEMRDQSIPILREGRNLDELLDAIESEIIYMTLLREGRNISHAAERLRIRRSTLQNKIKRLQVEARFERIQLGPIRRFRKTKEDMRKQKMNASAQNMGGLIQNIMEEAQKKLSGTKSAKKSKKGRKPARGKKK